MRVILVGPPGSGKGTIAKGICKAYPFCHVSTGQLFRDEMKHHTELGEQIRQYMDEGSLVPDELTLTLVKRELAKPEVLAHFLFDGFPRTLAQARQLDQLLAEFQVQLDLVLHIDLSDEAIKARLTGRRVCSQCGETYHLTSKPPKVAGCCDLCKAALEHREDDTEAVVHHRLEEYHRLTEALVQYYREQGKLVTIVADGNIQEVLQKVKDCLQEVAT